MANEPAAQRGTPPLPNRRELLQVGFSTALGLGLSGIVTARASAADDRSKPHGRAKSVILVYQTTCPRSGWKVRERGRASTPSSWAASTIRGKSDAIQTTRTSAKRRSA